MGNKWLLVTQSNLLISNIQSARGIHLLTYYIWEQDREYMTSCSFTLNKTTHHALNLLAGYLSWYEDTKIARFMGPTWGPSGADRTQVGPMLAPWTLLSGYILLRRPLCPYYYHFSELIAFQLQNELCCKAFILCEDIRQILGSDCCSAVTESSQ